MSLWETFRNQYPKSSKSSSKSSKRSKSGAATGSKKNAAAAIKNHRLSFATTCKNNNYSNHNNNNNNNNKQPIWVAATFPNDYSFRRQRRGFRDDDDIIDHKDHNDSECRSRRDPRRRLGERLAQKRAFSQQPSSDCFKDGSNVIFRRAEDWSSQQTYVKCLFLSDHQDTTVLAVDMSGKVDIIKLPPYGSFEGNKPRILGTPLVSRLESLPSLNGSSSSTTFRLKAIRGGRAFVMGMPNGQCHIFSTERTAEWPDLHKYSNASFTQQQQQLKKHGSTYNIQSAWSVNAHPRRRYYRDYSCPHRTLSAMMASPDGQWQQDAHDAVFSEIPGWDDSSSSYRASDLPDFWPRQRPSNHAAAKWDFRETPSSLLSVHIDPEHDCFSWLRIGDDRTTNPIVCVDKEQHQKGCRRNNNNKNNNGGCSWEEHISACAFVSDKCVVTSHVSLPPRSRHHHSYNDYSFMGAQNVVKLWDLRMLRGEPSESLWLPQFPYNASIGLEAIATKNTTATVLQQDENDNTETMNYNRDEDDDWVVTGLSAPSTETGPISATSGNLLVTFQKRRVSTPNAPSHSAVVEHRVLDLGRLEFTNTIRQHYPHPGRNPVYSAAGTHNFLAYATSSTSTSSTTSNLDNDDDDEEAGTSIYVYDLLKNETKTASTAAAPLAGKKRVLNGTNCHQTTATKEGMGSTTTSTTPSIQFDPILKDRHGLQTTLSCMEMNHDGTAILGGSVDGDLFLWRSP